MCRLISAFCWESTIYGPAFVSLFSADKSEPKANTTNQEVSQILQDMGDDVYQQYRSLTRQSSDFDSQTGFGINVSPSDLPLQPTTKVALLI